MGVAVAVAAAGIDIVGTAVPVVVVPARTAFGRLLSALGLLGPIHFPIWMLISVVVVVGADLAVGLRTIAAEFVVVGMVAAAAFVATAAVAKVTDVVVVLCSADTTAAADTLVAAAARPQS